MRTKRIHASLLVVASLMFGSNNASATECGDVSIASMSWSSAEVVAEIDKIILSAGYGCNAQLATTETMPAFQSMLETGFPDLIPELWINAVRSELDVALGSGELTMAAQVLSDGGEEGWWIPKYLADEHPEIKSAADALARPELFVDTDTDTDSDTDTDTDLDGETTSGVVHNCPNGWGCQISSGNLFRAYEAEAKGFVLKNTGSAAGLDASIAKAYENNEGWLGYYWAPTSLLGRYEMVKLDMGEHNRAHWHSCTAIPNCEEPLVNSWPTSDVYSVVTTEFSERAGVVMDYLSVRQWDNLTVNKLLLWIGDNQSTGSEAAMHFLENYEDVWSEWVSVDVFDKVKASMAADATNASD